MSTENTEMKIRARAYELWEAAGRPLGQAEEHWFRAYQEVSGSPAMTTSDAPSPKRATRGKKVESAPLAPEEPPAAPAKKKAAKAKA
jgi:hypothetical protein